MLNQKWPLVDETFIRVCWRQWEIRHELRRTTVTGIAHGVYNLKKVALVFVDTSPPNLTFNTTEKLRLWGDEHLRLCCYLLYNYWLVHLYLYTKQAKHLAHQQHRHICSIVRNTRGIHLETFGPFGRKSLLGRGYTKEKLLERLLS